MNKQFMFWIGLVCLLKLTTACNYDFSTSSGCSGTCNMRNSVCEIIKDTDMLYCGCSWCNFNSTLNECVGLCSNRQLGKCIGRVAEPKSDSDCACASCTKSINAVGTILCSGSCYESGLSCKVTIVPAYNLQGYSKECVCS